MDNFNSGKIKEMVYDVLQNPTRENFIDILDNGLGEQDNLDFKVQWIEAQKLAEIIYVFLTIFLYLPKCPQSLILSALRAFCFCGKPCISRSIFLYFPCQSWLKSW